MTLTTASYVNRFDTLTVTWSSVSPASNNDWIGLYDTGAISGSVSSLWWIYVSAGSTSGTVSTNMYTNHNSWRVPYSSGSYEFRYFCCGSYNLEGVSNTITVVSSSGGPSSAPITASPTTTALPTPLPTPVAFPPSSSGLNLLF